MHISRIQFSILYSRTTTCNKKAEKSALDILLRPEEDTRGRTIKDEVEAYLHEKVCAHKTNVLEW